MTLDLCETVAMPPILWQDKWTLDPAKIVTRAQKQTLPAVPEEENIIVPIQTAVISVEKHVRFAPYNIHHKRINGQDFTYKMEPLRVGRTRSEILEDENLILKIKNKKLIETLISKNKRIIKLETINAILTCVPLLVLLIAYVIITEYFSAK